MSGLDVLHLVTVILAVIAGVLALFRIARGPTLLDRTVANDVFAAVAIDLVAVMIVWWSRADLGVLLIVLALTGFLTAVVVARFAVREDARSRRILSAEEAERQRVVREREAVEAERVEAEDAARQVRERERAAPGGDPGPAQEQEEES